MRGMVAKCGCSCSRCPTFKANLQTFGDRQRCSDGWRKYLGIRLRPEKLRLCDGCHVPDEKRKVYYLNCVVRRCALKNGIENCAYCAAYPCEEVRDLHEIQREGAKDRIAGRLGAPIPHEDYLRIIEPYEGIEHLNEIRSSLDPEDMVEVTPVSLRSRIADFPDVSRYPAEEKEALGSLHHLLDSINGPVEGISFARRETLKKRRPFLLMLLWTFGLYGRPQGGDDPCLMINSKAYFLHKNQSIYSRVKSCFEIFKEHGVRCELMPLVDKGWITPGGALRAEVGKNAEPAWLMKMSFDDGAGGPSALKALQHYAGMLSKEHGEKAFRFFSKADMQVLSEKLSP